MKNNLSMTITTTQTVCRKSWYIPNFVYRAVLKRLLSIEASGISIKENV